MTCEGFWNVYSGRSTVKWKIQETLTVWYGKILKSIADAADTKIYNELNSVWAIDEFSKYLYSDTYERLYDVGKIIEYDYIHGKADINNTIQTNDMVLGIDEYLSDELRNKETAFITFKKYYQRIYKKSKRLTEIWCSEIKKEAEYEKNSREFLIDEQIKFDLVRMVEGVGYNWKNYEKLRCKLEQDYDAQHPKHELYIFGHSLDVTDKDILRELLLNDNVHTTIFYCKKKERLGLEIMPIYC